jgi:nucleotide-binding universal stress UspA family protein
MRIQFQNILCATDLSDHSNYAVTHGIALARVFQGQLHVCHVVDFPTPAMYGEAYIAPQEQLDQGVVYAEARIREIMAGQQIRWAPEIAVGSAADEIARLAEEKNAQIVVAATHGRTGLQRLLLGSVCERLIRTLPCPLLVVRGPERELELPLDGAFRLRRILVGCDFSPDSDLGFAYALSLAQEFQAELHVAHVIEATTYMDGLKSGIEYYTPTRDRELRDFLQTRLDRLVPEEARNWCDLRTVLLEGRPDESLMEYAEDRGVDLIVLGTRGHGLIGTLLLGSTTDRVVRRAPCPVLSVRAGAARSSAA